jgi:hypothetical protein
VEVKQRWSVIGWVTKNLLSRAPPCFGRHVKPLVPAAFAVVSTNPKWARVVGYCPFSLCVIHKEGLCPSSGDINRLMMMMNIFFISRMFFFYRLPMRWLSCKSSVGSFFILGEIPCAPSPAVSGENSWKCVGLAPTKTPGGYHLVVD